MDCQECNTPMIQGNTYSPFHAVASLAGLGQTATATVNVDKIILRYYQELYPRTSASYSDKTPRTSGSYSTKTPRTSASYTDKVAS